VSPSLRPRHNAIAELDAQIARAEGIRSQHTQDLKVLLGAHRTRALLRMAEERLDRLRRSGDVLLSGERA
jgi:hypothetical protein